MKTRRLLLILLLTLVSVSAFSQTNPNLYTLRPVKLTNGWQVTGYITTDGTVGYLNSTNIVDWNLKVVQTTDVVWDQTNSSAANIGAFRNENPGAPILQLVTSGEFTMPGTADYVFDINKGPRELSAIVTTILMRADNASAPK